MHIYLPGDKVIQENPKFELRNPKQILNINVQFLKQMQN